MRDHPIVRERKLEALRHALGDDVLRALCDPLVVEILVNPDGRLIVDQIGLGRIDTGKLIPTRRSCCAIARRPAATC